MFSFFFFFKQPYGLPNFGGFCLITYYSECLKCLPMKILLNVFFFIYLCCMLVFPGLLKHLIANFHTSFLWREQHFSSITLIISEVVITFYN